MRFENRQDEKKRRIKEGHLKKSKCGPFYTRQACWRFEPSHMPCMILLLMLIVLHGNLYSHNQRASMVRGDALS